MITSNGAASLTAGRNAAIDSVSATNGNAVINAVGNVTGNAVSSAVTMSALTIPAGT